jgi:hypothetical protein
MSTKCALKRTGLILAVAAMATVPVTKPSARQAHIAPIQSHPYGQTYNEWASRWWRVALETPAPVNPLADQTGENCDQGDMGNVWFLFGSLGTDPIERKCVIPADRAIFFPVLNQFFGAFLNDPDEQRTEAFAREQVACIKEGAELLVEFDGTEVSDVDQFFEESMATNAPPPVPPNDFGASLQRLASLFAVQLPEDNVFGVGEDVIPMLRLDPAVDAGFYLFLFPLRPGRHELHWKASSETCQSMQDITYHLTIIPGPPR